MTDAEFGVFAKRLFVQFPSLHEWLQRSSPDPLETQKLWRKTLGSFSLEDCLGVLDFWQANNQTPFEAYERDKVAVIIRSVIHRKMDKEARKREREEEAKRIHERERGNKRGQDPLPTFAGDEGCLAAFKELQPIFKRWKEGEIDRVQYKELENEVLERLIR